MLSRYALIGLFLLVLLATLSVARPIVVPVLAALVVGMTIGRPVDIIKRMGFPPWIVAVVVVGITLSALLAGAVLLATPVSDWVARAPGVTTLIKDRLHILARPMSALQEISASLSNMGGDKSQMAVDVSQGNIIQSVLTFLTPALSEFVLFFGALLFFLLGRTRMKGKLVLSLVDRANRLMMLRIIADVESDLATYLMTTTMINLGVGLCTTAIAWGLGVPNAPLWGSLAFFLNYLPYIGPALMAAILLVVGLITFPTLGQSLAPVGLFVGLTIVEGQLFSPALLGKRLELNPLAVFLGIAFWTWLWGPIGAFLSVPLLVIGMVIWRNISPTDVIDLP
ncbi:AI-2E family transporter [Methylocapsa sp. S129]|uniref:AI-2E family transporter n=1 Tax=Methylocapsa sp. S129 TaxID=1641869 RepID=UPI00131DCCC9|nr:AI-2E family transporter [Methylocapsa sp. S129]